MKTFKGYCTHNNFGGYALPVPMQNIIYLDYARKNSAKLLLSTNELYFHGCYVHLNELCQKITNINAILFCSISMLPSGDHDLEKILFGLINKGIEAHFIFEGICIATHSDIEKLINLLKLKKLNISSMDISKKIKQNL
jgi:sporadic carbohydrate cluster protein (TIGR04323 family)